MQNGRYLIAIGIPEIKGADLPRLEKVEQDISDIENLFTSKEQGYTRILADEIPLGATSAQIREGLATWFSDSENRCQTDYVIVYFAGHGESEEFNFGEHSLLTSDSKKDRSDLAIKVADLGAWFFGGRIFPQNVLLILDVCFAGHGAANIISRVAEAQKRSWQGTGFWVIASSGYNSQAGDGKFVQALLATMKDDAWLPRGGTKFFSPNDVSSAVNEWFKANKSQQKAGCNMILGGNGISEFIRNPQFTHDFDGINLADMALWDIKVRGTDVPKEQEYFFIGRKAVLNVIVDWITSAAPNRNAIVVTGSPGSGKSTVLAWLVMTSTMATRNALKEAGMFVEQDVLAPENSIDIHLQLIGKNLASATRMLAASLGFSTSDPLCLLNELAKVNLSKTILLDSLDEASEPMEIECKLLNGLIASQGIKIIIGTRKRGKSTPFSERAIIIDLDDASYFQKTDIEDYIFRRLIKSNNIIYKLNSEIHHVREIAGYVANHAGYSFLYARLVCSALLRNSLPIAVDLPNWQSKITLPTDIKDAFAFDLKRFGGDKNKILNLLMPLAYAKGKGLPQKNIWHSVASGIAGELYTNSDIHFLMERAAYYIVIDSENGSAVFRLFHASFAEYLRDISKEEDVEKRIVESLLIVSNIKDSLKWNTIQEAYINNYLPAHIAAAGLLDEYFADLDFLCHFSPELLIKELSNLQKSKTQLIASAYRKSSYWLRAGCREKFLAYMLLETSQRREFDMTKKIREHCKSLPWVTKWALHSAGVSSYVLAYGEQQITALAAVSIGTGLPIAICGYSDGSIKIWNIVNNLILLDLYSENDILNTRNLTNNMRVKNIEVVIIDGQIWIVASWADNFIGVFIVDDRMVCGYIKIRKLNVCENCLRICFLDQRPILVIADDDSTLSIFSLPALEVIRKKKKATNAKIYALSPIFYKNECCIISVNDIYRDGVICEKCVVRIWNLNSLKVMWKGAQGGLNGAFSVATIEIEGDEWIVISNHGVKLLFANPLTNKVVIRVGSDYHDSINDFIFSKKIGNSTVIIGLKHDHIYVLKINTEIFEETVSLYFENLPTTSKITSNIFRVVQYNKRMILLAVDAKQLRTYEIDDLLHENGAAEENIPDLITKGQVLSGATYKQMIVICGKGGRIICLEYGGKVKWSKIFNALSTNSDIYGVAIFDFDMEPTLVAVTRDCALYKISLNSGNVIAKPIKLVGVVVEFCGTTIGGGTVLIAMRNDANSSIGNYCVRSWNVCNWCEVDTLISDKRHPQYWRTFMDDKPAWAYQLNGYSDKPLNCVDGFDGENVAFVAFGGAYGKVCVINFATLIEVDEWESPTAHKNASYVHSLASGECKAGIFVVGGTECGILFIHEIKDLKARGAENMPDDSNFQKSNSVYEIVDAHVGSIRTICIVENNSKVQFVSGGQDGIVRGWSLAMGEIFSIEVGVPISKLISNGTRELIVITKYGVICFDMQFENI